MKMHTAEEKVTIAKKICDKYASGMFTIDNCAESEAISVRTFTNWCNENSEISDMYKQAQLDQSESYKRTLKNSCLTNLQRLVEGYECEDIEQVDKPIYDKNGVKTGTQTVSIRRTKKRFAPNVTAVIFALKALDPSTYKDNLPVEQQQEQIFLICGKEVKF